MVGELLTEWIAGAGYAGRVAIRNVLRQRGRSAMTLAAIAFGVVGLIFSGGFVADIFVQLGEAIIHSQSGHIQLAKTDFFTKGSRSPDKYLISDPQGEKAAISSLQSVNDSMARILFSGLLNNGRTGFPIIGEGVEPDKEAPLDTYLVITQGRHLTTQDQKGIILGDGVAHALALKPGDLVTVQAATAEGAMNLLEFEVVGVFQSFSKEYDNRAVKISLSAAQELLDTKGANLIVVFLKATADTESVAAKLDRYAIAHGMEVRTWRELNDFYSKTVQLYDQQFGVLRLIILVMVLLSVLNAVNMSIMERAGEFGTMRALGNRGRRVLGTVLLESFLLGTLGAAVGTVIGVLLALGISEIGIPMPPPPNSNLGYTAHIRLVPAVVAGAFLVGLAATVLASIPPAIRVSRMSVVDALRQNV